MALQVALLKRMGGEWLPLVAAERWPLVEVMGEMTRREVGTSATAGARGGCAGAEEDRLLLLLLLLLTGARASMQNRADITL